MADFSPHVTHRGLLEKAERALRFRERCDFAAWREQISGKVRELVGLLPERRPLNVRIISDTRHEGFRELEMVYTAEEHCEVPCHLLLPDKPRSMPMPVMICLQGHSPGMHISLGRLKSPEEAKLLEGDRDFGVQAVGRGYAALILEQRAFGQREDTRSTHDKQGLPRCSHASMTALLLGRTMIGERTWDVSRGIDMLESVAGEYGLDPKRIGCMGNSGGGTTTYYAAALDARISAAMPSCVVCSYGPSLGTIGHCVDNYLPGALRWFDMGDVAAMICPRPLLVVAGREDRIFPIAGVEEAFGTISAIYRAAGAGDRCAMVVGEGGHRFYADIGWRGLEKLTGW